MRRLSVIALIVLLCATARTGSAAEVKKRKTGTKKPVVEASVPTTTGRGYSSLVPADGSLINNAKPTISAEYADEGIGINPADTKLYLDGEDVTAQAQVTATKVTLAPAQPLADGLHKVSLTIDDKAGNPATATWTFTLHTQPPKIKITSHKPNQYLNQSPILVTGTVDDMKARVVLNGIVAAVEQGTFSAKVNLIEGSNTITAVATDAFGNAGNDTMTVILDSKPPTIQITSPLINSLQNAKLITVTGTADAKATSIVVSTPTATQPVTATIANGIFTAKDVALEEGQNIITAKAVSAAGNTGMATVKVTVDTVPPQVIMTMPKDQSLTNKKMITVTGTVDDAAAVVKVNNTPVQVSKGSFTLSGVNLAEGSNTITATAVDRAGNQATPATIVVVLKTIPPAPPKLGDLPVVSKVEPITANGTAEPGSQVELFMNSASKGTVKADEKGVFSFKVILQEGNNAFSAVASDAVGNVSASSAVVNVFLDKTPPRIL